jgi:hypothetical protein
MATRRRFRSSLVGALVLALACASVLARGSDDLEQAKQLYREGRFPESIAKLRMALVELPLLRDLEVRRVQLADAYLHLALAQVALADRESAKQAFKEMLRVDPQRTLDPEIYAPKVVALFEESRSELGREPRAVASEPATAGGLQPAARKGRNVPLLAGAGVAAAGIGLAAARLGGRAATTPTTLSHSIFTPLTGSGRARIVWLTAAPSPGSRVSLRSGSCSNGVLGLCSTVLHFTFEVTPETDVEGARLSVELLDGTLRYMRGFSNSANLSAGTPFPMNVDFWYVDHTPPFTTTTMTAFLYGTQGQTIALEGFAGGFSFLP